ncbi:sulfatase-like hydrolase/transferase [Chelativorans sp. AA-79]|uniref:sulfatase-like hydrolase/transferase n=1 Tax=Chelativorans sp. AA-79 TaxID=3028735 RepID=UPI0023F69037|nr:sulfatase-like hydrolase/transferase [Chelativorans sp. AA-79]WEX12157.1 sulfatase-like hydrolase/transferase [Chelativorans sp. AA-79]
MSRRPNVLLITVDQWPGDLLGASGHPLVETPTLDALAHTGVHFRSVYSECPICIPSRRTLMTGMSPRAHGDRIFKPTEPMPDVVTMAQAFRNVGYQAYSVGKLHVHPQRDRIGFDDALLAEEGRPQLGTVDDYDMYLAQQGYVGQQYMHGMSNNEYDWRPWHLPEHTHVTNWTATEMCRTIKRRDPTRPAFWNLSFSHPHPPLVPPQTYLDRYDRFEMSMPGTGDWARNEMDLPFALRASRAYRPPLTERMLQGVQAAFFALCTHIDHQIRLVLGTLREERILNDTVILFTSDHGEMLGRHGLLGKRLFYERSSCVPTILVAPNGCDARLTNGVCDQVFGLADIMPTLLDLAGIDMPDICEGISMASLKGREYIYGECLEDAKASRMIRKGGHKLIWYPAGNALQLFDLTRDPEEHHDLANDASWVKTRRKLETLLIDCLYGKDLDWVRNGALAGFAEPDLPQLDRRDLGGQRGLHYPQPPLNVSNEVVGAG